MESLRLEDAASDGISEDDPSRAPCEVGGEGNPDCAIGFGDGDRNGRCGEDTGGSGGDEMERSTGEP